MRTHLTTEDLIKYMDTTDMSEEYLLWFEGINGHIESCETCRQLLEKAIRLESTLQEENFGQLFKLAEYEAEIRRSIVACKLQMMYSQDLTRNVAGTIVAEAIRQLQVNAVKSYMLQMSSVAGRAGVARGEEGGLSLTKEDGVEILVEDSELLVKTDAMDNQKKFTAVLDRKEKSPMVCEAVWEEEKKQWVAKFNMDELMEQFEIYIIE